MIEKLMQTMVMAGADLPAYRALFEAVMATMASDDQIMLKQTYDEVLAQAASAHTAAQAD